MPLGSWLSLAAITGSFATRGARSDTLKPCALEGVAGTARCGTFEVPEDRSRPEGRRIALNIVVLPATGPRREADPLVFLAGGGVLPATRSAAFLARVLSHTRTQRDILLIDQRGTGKSNPLRCDLRLPRPAGDVVDRAAVSRLTRACVEHLQRTADLPHYSTTEAMRDLDAVREGLGYSQLSLWGVSYGTKAAREYVRLFPDRARVVVLHGVVPRDFPWWFEIPRSAEAGLDSLAASCLRDDACREQFGDVRRLLDSVVARAQQRPAVVILSRPGGSGSDTVTVDAAAVRNVVHTMLYESAFARRIPLLARVALQGDWEPLARWAVPGPSPIPRGVFFTILCAEQFADWTSPVSAGVFFGKAGIPTQLAVCEEWPRFPIDPGLRREFPSEVPTLILTGAHDHTTPPAYGERTVAGLARGRHVVLAGRGHNDADRCVIELIERFLERPEIPALDTSCAAVPPPTPFATSKAELR